MRTLLIVLMFAVGLLAALVAGGQRGFGPIVITDEGQQKIILTLGDPRKLTEPGWNVYLPGLEKVKTYDRRLLYLSTERAEIPTKDQERVVVDNYVVWKISEPIVFYSSFPDGMNQAEPQINQIVRAGVREMIGQHTLNELLTEQRLEIMREITQRTNEQLANYGISVQDVRINRTELPSQTEDNVFARMQTERQRLARGYRAEGEEKARGIRAEADRDARVIVAEARKRAEIARGQGDAAATRIYAEAHSQDPDFYAFTRSLEAYRKSIDENTTLILSPDSEFFQFFESSQPTRQNGARRGGP